MSPTGPAALEFRGTTKLFGSRPAVRDVSLRIEAGLVTGLVGENGAGKSTLMNLASGLFRPDDGEILVRGRAAALAGTSDAQRLGIGMVHQHFMLVDTMSVAENVVLGAETGPFLRASFRRCRRELRRLAEQFGIAVDPDAIVGDLPVGAQQRVEILRALYRGADLLILDEPTAVLAPSEADRLFVILRELAARGTTVVLVSHKLREIMDVTSRVVVMRQGEVVAERTTAATSELELARLMIGGELSPSPVRSDRAVGDVLLRADGLAVVDRRTGIARLDGADLSLRSGEIVGIAGVAGNGQGELLEALAGMRPLTRGRIRIGSREVTPEWPAGPADMRRLGVAHVPEHRQRHGMVDAFTAAENAMLGYHRERRFGWPLLRRPATRRACAALMADFDVRPPDPHLAAGRLSGGNQQKLVVGREVSAGPRILLVGQPTRGVDIGAVGAIHAELRRLREAGAAILLVSAELDEIISLSDRIFVMLNGRIVGEVDDGSADAEAIGLMMSRMPDDQAAAA